MTTNEEIMTVKQRIEKSKEIFERSFEIPNKLLINLKEIWSMEKMNERRKKDQEAWELMQNFSLTKNKFFKYIGRNLYHWFGAYCEETDCYLMVNYGYNFPFNKRIIIPTEKIKEALEMKWTEKDYKKWSE